MPIDLMMCDKRLMIPISITLKIMCKVGYYALMKALVFGLAHAALDGYVYFRIHTHSVMNITQSAMVTLREDHQ